MDADSGALQEGNGKVEDSMDQSNKAMTRLGYGKARDFEAKPGEQLVEVGGSVFSVSHDFFCKRCEGIGCKPCKWTGEEAQRQKRSS
jgi:hypothetical protein